MPSRAPRACGRCGRAGCTQHAQQRQPNNHHGLSRQQRGLGADHEAMRKRVMREEKQCGICGGPGLPNDEADHVIARSRGGSNERSNYQRAHRKCNARKRIGA